MKRKFLLIPMLAGLMLAASCSKDDGTSVADDVITPSSEPTPAVEQPVAEKTYPLTIQAKKETSVSKIGLGEGLSQLFESADKLLLIDDDVKTSEVVYAVLELDKGEGTTSAIFKTNLTEAEKSSIEGKIIRAVVKGTDCDADKVQSSTISLADAVHKYCYLQATETFTYKDGEAIPTLTLADKRAYIQFNVADGQYKVDVDGVWYPEDEGEEKKQIDKENKYLCVVVSVEDVKDGKSVSTRMRKNSKYVFPGFVYTITCTDYVDLGQTIDDKKILWKTTNETRDATSVYNKSDTRYSGQAYYNWSTAESNFSTSGDGPRLPTQNELTALKDMFKTSMWDGTNGGVNFENDYGSVFFPASGYGSYSASTLGYFWSGETAGSEAYYLLLDSRNASVNTCSFGYEFSVRLVRGL